MGGVGLGGKKTFHRDRFLIVLGREGNKLNSVSVGFSKLFVSLIFVILVTAFL